MSERATIDETVALSKRLGRCLCPKAESGPEDPDWDGTTPKANECPYHGDPAVYAEALRQLRSERTEAENLEGLVERLAEIVGCGFYGGAQGTCRDNESSVDGWCFDCVSREAADALTRLSARLVEVERERDFARQAEAAHQMAEVAALQIASDERERADAATRDAEAWKRDALATTDLAAGLQERADAAERERGEAESRIIALLWPDSLEEEAHAYDRALEWISERFDVELARAAMSAPEETEEGR